MNPAKFREYYNLPRCSAKNVVGFRKISPYAREALKNFCRKIFAAYAKNPYPGLLKII